MPRILLIGSDRYFAEACVARGVEVVAARNADAVTSGVFPLPEAVHQVPVSRQSDVEAVLGGLGRAGFTLDDFDGIYTNSEFAVVMTAGLAEAAGLPGLGVRTAVLMRDKYLQKRRLESAGVPVARSLVFDTPPAPADVASLGFPLVLKPVAGVGTEATTRVDDEAAFRAVVAAFFADPAARRTLLVEQFVVGEEFILDGWVRNGVIGFSSPARYAKPCLEAFDTGAAMRVYQCGQATHPGLADRAAELASAALTALGMRQGVFHLEFFRTADDRLVFGECAGRRGGGLTEEQVRLARSVSLAESSLDLCLGADPDIRPADAGFEVASVHPRLPGGVVLGLPATDRLGALDGVEYVRYFTHLGATVAATASATDQHSATILVRADSLAELDARLDRAESEFLTHSVVSPATSPQRMREFQVETLGRTDLRDLPYARPAGN